MSKTVELAEKLAKLNIADMFENDFYWTWDKTDAEIDAVFTVADALRHLRERNISTKVFDSGLGISIFRDNSTRTRFSFASASFSASTYTQGSAGISSPSACIFFNAASLPCPSSTWFISSCAHTKNGNEKPCFLMLLIILFMSAALRCFNAP